MFKKLNEVLYKLANCWLDTFEKRHNVEEFDYVNHATTLPERVHFVGSYPVKLNIGEYIDGVVFDFKTKLPISANIRSQFCKTGQVIKRVVTFDLEERLAEKI